MQRSTFFVLLAATLALGNASPARADSMAVLGLTYPAETVTIGWERLRTEETFRKHIAGRVMVQGGAATTVHADGTTSGTTFSGERFESRWHWASGQFCHDGSPDGAAPGVNCSQVHIATSDRLAGIRATRVRFTSGSGESVNLSFR